MIARIIAVGVVLFATSSMAQTSGTVTRATMLPVFGLGSTETARVSVVNVAPASSSGTAASCTGSISFLNASGAAIGGPVSFTAGSGQIVSASLPFSSAGLSGTRGEIRAAVTLTTSTASAPCNLQVSVSTFDTSTGATHLFAGGAEASGPFGRH